MLTLSNVKKYFKKKKPTWNKVKDFFFPKYERVEALKWISFQVEQWEKIAFIWPNGAGKSTTIKAILGILHYDEGEITIFGKNPIKDRTQISKSVASVFWQRSQLLYHLPLKDSFEFFQIIYDIPEKIYKTRLDRFIKKFKMEDFLNTPVRKLSLWQRMKGEIVVALLHGPKVIFLDEPTVWLDIIAKKVLYEILLDIHKEENITIFLTSHDIKDVESLCDRAVVINEGNILFDGKLDKLMQTYANQKIIKYKKRGEIDWETIEIENNADLLEEQIRYIFDNYKIADLKVENVSLEKIVEEFY